MRRARPRCACPRPTAPDAEDGDDVLVVLLGGAYNDASATSLCSWRRPEGQATAVGGQRGDGRKRPVPGAVLRAVASRWPNVVATPGRCSRPRHVDRWKVVWRLLGGGDALSSAPTSEASMVVTHGGRFGPGGQTLPYRPGCSGRCCPREEDVAAFHVAKYSAMSGGQGDAEAHAGGVHLADRPARSCRARRSAHIVPVVLPRGSAHPRGEHGQPAVLGGQVRISSVLVSVLPGGPPTGDLTASAGGDQVEDLDARLQHLGVVPGWRRTGAGGGSPPPGWGGSITGSSASR